MSKSLGVSFLIGATLGSSVGAAFSSLRDRIRDTQQSFRTASRQSRQLSGAVQARTRRDFAANRAREQMRDTGRVDDSLRKELGELNRAYAEAARKAGVYGQSLEEINRTQRQMSRNVEDAEATLRRLTALQGQRDLRGEIVSRMRNTIAPLAITAMPVKLAIDFESAMADVKKVTNFDAPGFEKFSGDILRLSTRLPMAADGLAAIAAAAGQSGIAQEELLTFTEDAAKMGVAFDISAAEAGSAMTGLRNNFKLTQDGIRLLGDSMNALANSMDAKASAIVNFANRAGGTAKTYGMTGQEVAALGAAFLDAKVGVEEASTATNTMLVNLGTASKLPKAAQAGFASLGLSASAVEKAFKKDAQAALLSFLETVKKSKDPMSALTDIFGKEHAPKIVRLMNNLEHYQDALKTVSAEEKYAGSMNDEYAVRAQTTANNIQLLKNTFNRLGITIGSVLLPPLNRALGILSPMISGIADFARENETLTRGIALAGGGFLAFRVGALVFRYVASLGRTAGIQIGGAMAGARRALSIPWPFAPIRNGLKSIGRDAAGAARRLRQLGPAGIAAGAGQAGIKLLGGACRVAGRGARSLGAAFKMAFGPVSLLMMGLSYGADYVIENWDKVAPYFSSLWEGVKKVFNAVVDWMGPIVDTIAGLIKPVSDAVSWVADKIGNGISSVWNWASGGEKAEQPETGETQHARNSSAPAQAAPAPAATQMKNAGAAAPKPITQNFAPPSVGLPIPAREEAKAGSAPAPQAMPPATGPVISAMPAKSGTKTEKSEEEPDFGRILLQMSRQKQGKPPASAPQDRQNQIVQPQIQVSLNITQNGVPEQTFAQGVMNAIRARQSELEGMISAIVNEQARLAYE